MFDIEPLHDISEILGAIGRQQRDNLIAYNLPHFMSQNIGITNTMRIFREFGYKFSDSTFRDIWYKVQKEETLQRLVMFHNRMETIPDDILAPTKYPVEGSRYLYVGRIEVFDSENNTVSDKHYAISTSKQLQHYQLEEMVRQGYLTDSDPRATILDVQLIRGYINEAEPISQ